MHAVLTDHYLPGDTKHGNVDWKACRSRIWDTDILPGHDKHGIRSGRTGSRTWTGTFGFGAGWGVVGDAAKPAVGADVCGTDVGSSGNSGVRQFGERAGRSHARRDIQSDVDDDAEWANTKFAELPDVGRQLVIAINLDALSKNQMFLTLVKQAQ